MEGLLVIQGVSFKINKKKRDTSFFISKNDDDTLEISLDISCKSGIVLLSDDDDDEEPMKERVLPSLSINAHSTQVKTQEELIGQSFRVDTLEEADEREDTFYLFEHEPFVKYKLDVLAIEKNRVHISCEGIAVTDGYAKPYKSDEFKLDCWLPIIIES